MRSMIAVANGALIPNSGVRPHAPGQAAFDAHSVHAGRSLSIAVAMMAMPEGATACARPGV
jgi:hypothetical protein